MTTQALTEIMALVDDVATARDETTKTVAASLILLRVCALTGDDARAEMEKRRAPCAPLKVPSHQRALKAPKGETQDQVVEQLVDRLELRRVPVGDEVGEGVVAKCRDCGGPCSGAEDLCEGCGRHAMGVHGC